MTDDVRVLIAGGGVGGLALAQALRRGGVAVTVFEQDPTPQVRGQGYRIHIDANGNAALRACLPADVFDLVRRTSGVNGNRVVSYTHQLTELTMQAFPGVTDELITCVDRNTLRRGLLTGLDDVVRFGVRCVGYRLTDSGRVRVDLADGSVAEGDVLVGADGVGSAVRGALLPHAAVRDLGLRCLYGRMPITDALADPFDRNFVWVAGDRGIGAGFAPVRFRVRPADGSDYLMTTLVAPPERFGVSDRELRALPPAELWRLGRAVVADWHPTLRAFVEHADPGSFLSIALRAGERVDAWRSGPVTLLGDAIHTMPPAGGVGANTALQDAATLAGELLAAARGEQSVAAATAAYEAVMLPRGFDTVDSSLQMAAAMFAQPA